MVTQLTLNGELSRLCVKKKKSLLLLVVERASSDRESEESALTGILKSQPLLLEKELTLITALCRLCVEKVDPS